MKKQKPLFKKHWKDEIFKPWYKRLFIKEERRLGKIEAQKEQNQCQ